jgi:hypothetical protein
MKKQFNQKVRPTPDWKVGNKVWLNSKQIATTRPSPKLDHRWLGPFPIKEQISTSVYKLTLPATMRGVHPVFHVSILQKHNGDRVEGRHRPPPPPITVNGEQEWEVSEILDC